MIGVLLFFLFCYKIINICYNDDLIWRKLGEIEKSMSFIWGFGDDGVLMWI